MNKILIIGGHGLGDCLLSLQCSEVLARKHIKHTVILSVRHEIYLAVEYALNFQYADSGKYRTVKRINESYAANNNVLKDSCKLDEIAKGFDEVYYVIPDLLYLNDYAFNWKKYNVHPQVIKSVRLFDDNNPSNKIIYVNFATSNPRCFYPEQALFAVRLAQEMPDYKIYFPVMPKWNNNEIDPIVFPEDIPANLEIASETLTYSLAVLRESSYFVGTDNGPSHMAYHFGKPRLIVDPQFGLNSWISRWREDYMESIPFYTPIYNIINAVKMNISTPQTTLIPRYMCVSNNEDNIAGSLLLKNI